MGVLVVPIDAAVETLLEPFLKAAEDALRTRPGFRPLPSLPLIDAKGQEARERARVAGEKALDQGKRFYDDLDTRAAQSQFEQAVTSFQATNLAETFPRLSEAALFRAAALVANGDEDGARTAIEDVVAGNPDVRLPSRYFRPDDIAFSQRFRRSTDRRPLSVRTSPSAARILVDGVFVGFSPLEVQVRPGAHHVTALAQGRGLTQARVSSTSVDLSLPTAASPAYIASVSQIAQSGGDAARDAAASAWGESADVDEVMLLELRATESSRIARVSVTRVLVSRRRAVASTSADVPLDDAAASVVGQLVAGLATEGIPAWMAMAPLPEPMAEAGGRWTRRHTGYLFLGGAAALVAGGVFFATASSSRKDEARGLPPEDPTRSSIAAQGERFQFFSQASFFSALVSAGVGTYLSFLSQPAHAPTTARETGETETATPLPE